MRKYDILNAPPYFLRLLVQSHQKADQLMWRTILEGDQNTKVLCDWTPNKEVAEAAYEQEKARYVAAKAG